MPEFTFSDEIEHYSEHVEALCADRRVLGQQKYGGHTFVDRDMITYMQEELEDAINYCIFLHYKLEEMRTNITIMTKEVERHASSTDPTN